ncbi:MAG: flagellar biosynthesis protein FlhB [Alphaproteobacteria bacterium]
MSDDHDDSQKTEEPTQKRLSDARKRGQVPSSREINHWFILLAATLAIGMLLPRSLGDLTRALAPFLSSAHAIDLTAGNLSGILMEVFAEVGDALLVPLGLLILAALAAGFVQNGFVFASELIEPSLEKISLISGFKRLFSPKSLVEFTKGLIKIAIVGAAAVTAVLPAMGDLDTLTTYDLPAVLDRAQHLVYRLMIAVLAVMSLIAGLDYLYQRLDFRRRMRMSREEMKQEYKETEGDPMVRGRIRQLRQEKAKRRMMTAVPKADVVLTNPTHYAVALSYKPETMAAPVVVAKGVDSLALRIREVAREHAVPIVENPPLARALHAAVKIDQAIPPEHYMAVAKVIGYVMGLRQRATGRPG